MPSIAATYSTSIVDKVAIDYKDTLLEMALPQKVKM